VRHALHQPPVPVGAVRHLATGCAPLDGLLDGGLESDAITLVFGEGGSGKTNLALQCARQASAAGQRVAYVDTEGVSSVRLRQVFSAAVPEAVGPEQPTELRPVGPPGLEDLEEQILFFTPYSIEEQERMVHNATKVPGLGLLVVDSINMHYRLHIDTGGDAESDAARSLYKQLHHLTGFARQHQVPILVTGQVYGGEDTTQPFARRVMEHLVKALVRFEKRPDGARKATVLKHRSIEEGRSARFRIGAQGLEPADP
jgi:DNA repair protein RadB